MNIFNKMIAATLPFIPRPIVWQFSKRYIAGTDMGDASRITKDLNDLGMCATMDLLGEDTTKKEDAEYARDKYFEILDSIKEAKVDSGVSVKLTQMGLKLDKEFCHEIVHSLVEKADSLGIYLRIDMEDHTCTDDTLDIYYRLKQKYSNVGIVIQAYLFRTLDDVRKLVREKGNVRLCKGVYIEPEDIAYRDRQKVRDNFLLLLEELLKGGCYVGIATHDDYLIDGSYRIIEKLGLKKSDYEFQMLLGVTEHLRDSIVEKGDKMRIYVPFGEHWHAYCIRRLRENPTIAGYVAKSAFRIRRRRKPPALKRSCCRGPSPES
jgi:proline dehydrogenase